MSEPNSSPNGMTEDDIATMTDAAAQLEALATERDKLAVEKTELNDRLLRRTAEFDNFRRRTEKERGEFAEYAAIEAVQALLPILDDFERALKVETSDKEYARGMELIYQRTFDSLKKLGLAPLETVGKPFDPNLHHAVDSADTDEVDDQTVLADLQRGYTFKGRLLRPAFVKVAINPGGRK